MKFKVVSAHDHQEAVSPGGDVNTRIESMIGSSPVFLFMKGTPEMPQCGFSYRVCQVLSAWKVPFQSFNVLSDEAIRNGIKEFSNWPTIPQLYVNKSFVGGCDIIEELANTGEFKDVLQEAFPGQTIEPPPPPAKVKELEPEMAAPVLEQNQEIQVLDVRTPEEYDIVHLERAQLLTRPLMGEILNSWDKNTPIYAICHSGQRSREAAEFLTQQGFQDVTNIIGGIDRWAMTVDPSLPRY